MAQTDRAPLKGLTLLKATEVAEILSVSARSVWNLAAKGDLPTVRLGKRCTRFRERDVLALIERGA